MGWIDLITSLPSTIESWFARNDDDLFDRINHRYTVIQLVIFAAFVSAEAYIDKPISCWAPVHFHDSWEKYTNSYCWIRNTYYLPFQESIPREHGEREKHPILYYQWVPLILLAQAIMFYLPIVMWRTLNSKTGIDVNMIVETSEVYQKEEESETRVKLLDFLVRLTDRYLGYSKSPARGSVLSNMKECTFGCKSCLARFCCCCCGKRFGNYMVVLYIIIKFVFLANAVCQLFILNAFLGHDYNLYGLHALQSWIDGTDFGESKRFPKVTLCDLDVRVVGNVQRYSVQCVLTINLFHEMIYLYIWFWLVFVVTITIIGLIMWIMRLGIPRDRVTYIKRHLAAHPDFNYQEEAFQGRDFRKFVNRYLRQDGIFVLRLVDLNTNKLVLMELLSALWEFYKTKPTTPIKPTTDSDFDPNVDTLPIRGKEKELEMA